MKWNRAERWTDPSRLHSLLLAVFFFLGIGAGVVCAGRISGDVERELTTYLTDYLALAQSQDLGISVVCSLTLLYLQGPVLAFLCGVCSAGILLLPLLAAAAGFFPAYAAGCLTLAFWRAGPAAGAGLFRLSLSGHGALLFLLAAPAMGRAATLRGLSRGRRGAAFSACGRGCWLGFGIVCLILCLGAWIELRLSPFLPHSAAGNRFF
ncbi:MAG: hypothetical protein ACLU38_03580 [Dysosmobacter sp.]